MRSRHSSKLTVVLAGLTFWTSIGTSIVVWAGSGANGASSTGKIPITTKSEAARSEYLLARELSEKLEAQASLAHYDKAIVLDADFAMAELGRATNSPTAGERFQHLHKAVSLAGKVSDGERLAILATEAGLNGDVAKQKQYCEKLAESYPNDERAQWRLGSFYAAQQDEATAITHYKKAVDAAPGFALAYNSLGYGYRALRDYAHAEEAFRKYAELLPADPNPYDSYGELLLKMGRFEESIAQYKKALANDAHFAGSHLGIAADLMYMGKSDEAKAELEILAAHPGNDAELREAIYGLAVVAFDRGNAEQALQQIEREYAVAEKSNGVVDMATDLQAKGAILIQLQKYGEAKREFDRAWQLIEGSQQSAEFKDKARQIHAYNLAYVFVGVKDFSSAQREMENFRKGAEGSKDAVRMQQAHELAGTLALAQKDYDRAITELAQADPQNPMNLYDLYLAYEGKGDTAKAGQFCAKAASLNSLPDLNYAFIRKKAQKSLGNS
jgi:tetratricopeptide (TPR) repeat protein